MTKQEGGTIQIKKYFILFALGILLFAGTDQMSMAASVGPCIGNNYEQQAPVPEVQHPEAGINAVASLNEGETVLLTATTTVNAILSNH